MNHFELQTQNSIIHPKTKHLYVEEVTLKILIVEVTWFLHV